MVAVLCPVCFDHFKFSVVTSDGEGHGDDPVARLDHVQNALNFFRFFSGVGTSDRSLFGKDWLQKIGGFVIIEFDHFKEAGIVLGISRISGSGRGSQTFCGT